MAGFRVSDERVVLVSEETAGLSEVRRGKLAVFGGGSLPAIIVS